MRVLALDQGYNTGWSLQRPEMDQPISGTLKLQAVGTGNPEGPMLRRVRDFMIEVCTKYEVTHVIREGLFIAKKDSNPDSVLPRAYITGVIELTAADMGLPCAYARVDEWRLEFFGICRAPKYIKCSSAEWFKGKAFNECDRRGWHTVEHDEAEANGIGHYGLCVLDAEYRKRSRLRWGRAA